MNGFYIEVEPIIIYPNCLKSGNIQDCFNCSLQKYNKCESPRNLCVKFYKNHKKGCPNYGKKNECPPNAPMFDQVFNLNNPIYAIYSTYDLNAHVQKMHEKHPTWTEAQLLNVLYWQGTARKNLKQKILEFNKLFKDKGYFITTSPEAMGVDVTHTLQNVGISLEWPARKQVYKIAMAGIPLSSKYSHILI